MARLRTRMSKIKELLRLKFDCHLPNRNISACLNIGCSTVSDVVTRFREASWRGLPEEMTESQLEALLYTGRASGSHKRMPDFPLCHQELKRKGMTKILLWQEYQREAGENAYGYSQFCNLYGEWLKLQKRSMRQHHVAGEAVPRLLRADDPGYQPGYGRGPAGTDLRRHARSLELHLC